MKPKTKILSLSFLSIAIAGGAVVISQSMEGINFNLLNADGNANVTILTLSSENMHGSVPDTVQSFAPYVATWGNADKNTKITYSSAKYLEGGVCTLEENATIQKLDGSGLDTPSNGLKTFKATGEGELEIKTYFNNPNVDSGEEPYTYNFTLDANESTAEIVGNYFVVRAVGGNADINTLKFEYDCNSSAFAETGIHITDQNDYAELFRGGDDKVRLNVELESDTLDLSTFDASRITLRSSDNNDSYTLACYNLANRGGEYPNTRRVAQFNLSDLNTQTGSWTQFTYTAKIYVDGKRIDGSNGNIYVEGKTINTSKVQRNIEDDSQATSGFQLGSDSTNKVTTISWTNTINEDDASISNKGLRFVKMGTNGDVEYKHALSNAGDTGMYYNLFGWVATEEEAKEVAKNYSRYSIRNATSTSTITDFVGNSVPSRCTYAAADGGYQVKLSFDLSGLRGSKSEAGGYKKGNVIAGLYYDDVPYMYRGGGNTSGLRTTYSLNKTESVELGYDWYVTHVEIFYKWILLYAVHA